MTSTSTAPDVGRTLTLTVGAIGVVYGASQAVITGAYSLTQQAIALGLLPRMTIHQTSEHHAGQIYMPLVNWLLFAGVLLLVLGFRSSSAMAAAYGIAVIAFIIVHRLWGWKLAGAIAFIAPFLTIDLVFFGANILRVTEGGWVPLLVAAIMGTVIVTWVKGRELVALRTRADTVPLNDLINALSARPPRMVEGTAVFLSADQAIAPAALHLRLGIFAVLHITRWVINPVMKNRTPPRPKGHAIPKFTPVPRQRNRHDGWTPERQRAFIEALARTGSVSHAAREVNMAAEGAYQLRLHPKGESFRKAWEAALDFGVQRLEDIALERAMNGVLEPVFGRDGQIGERRRYNDRLLMFLLRHRLAYRYAPNKDELLTPQREAELRAQWREEMDRPSDGSRALEAIKQKLLQMKERGAGQEGCGRAEEEGEGAIDWEEEEEVDQPSPEPEQPQEKDEPPQQPRIRTF